MKKAILTIQNMKTVITISPLTLAIIKNNMDQERWLNG